MELEGEDYQDQIVPDAVVQEGSLPKKKNVVKQEWKYEVTEKNNGNSENPDKKLETIDLPLLRGEGSEQEWSYRRIRDLIALLHVGLFEYADRLSAYISYSAMFKSKFLKCTKTLGVVDQTIKHTQQDKVKFKEVLNDLGAKYNMLEHALDKADDINEDNKQVIEKIRVNRDKCLQTVDSSNDVITSLRNQNAELRRRLAQLRLKIGN